MPGHCFDRFCVGACRIVHFAAKMPGGECQHTGQFSVTIRSPKHSVTIRSPKHSVTIRSPKHGSGHHSLAPDDRRAKDYRHIHQRSYRRRFSTSRRCSCRSGSLQHRRRSVSYTWRIQECLFVLFSTQNVATGRRNIAMWVSGRVHVHVCAHA